MNDGEYHERLKSAVLSYLNQVDVQQLGELSRRWARLLLPLGPTQVHLQSYVFQLPVFVIASLLGLPERVMPEIAVRISEFVRCFAQNSNAEQIDAGKIAAKELLEYFRSFMRAQQAVHSDGLPSILSVDAYRGDNDR